MCIRDRAEVPNECCGLIATRDGEAVRFYPMRNEYESPMRFRLHGADLSRVSRQADERGEELSIVFHSHPRSEASPSQTDLNIADEMRDWYPDGRWVICSLAHDEPQVRAFQIFDRPVTELELTIVG